MSRVHKLRLFVSQRLNAAVEEILGVLEKTLMKYEEEAALSQEVISRQHALLCALQNPLTGLPAADAFTQQLAHTEVPAQDQDQDQDQEDPEPPREGEQEGDLDEAEIIQFTYKPRCAARPGEAVGPPAAPTEPGAAGPDQEIQLVSSETEDSDDYSKEPTEAGSASQRPKAKRGRRPGAGFSCRVCSRTFKARRFLLRHVEAHLQEAEPGCGLCGQRFDAAESLKLHIQTHRTAQSKLENQTRTRIKENRYDRQPDRSSKVHTSEKPHTCNDCGKTFLHAWKKKRHRCRPWNKNQESPETI